MGFNSGFKGLMNVFKTSLNTCIFWNTQKSNPRPRFRFLKIPFKFKSPYRTEFSKSSLFFSFPNQNPPYTFMFWNNKLYSLYKEPKIVENIKIRRLEWEGHIIRMEEERIPKKVLNGNFHTTRSVGRPRTRWADVLQSDALQLLGLRGWRRRVTNRDEWRRLVREAKARKGL